MVCRKLDFQNPENLDGLALLLLVKLPEYVNVYHSPEWIESTRTNAYIAVIDTKKGGSLDVGGEESGIKTPTEFYQSEKRKPVIVLNGGYFANGKTC